MKYDLTGQRFEKLVVTQRCGTDSRGNALWKCRCDCGNEVVANTRQLKNHNKRDCGCMMGVRDDLTGQRFGKLVAERPIGKTEHGFTLWHCRCDCGGSIDVESRRLKAGLVKDCQYDLTKPQHKRDYTGERYGRLTVLKDTGKQNKSKNAIWLCQCDCGNTIELATNQFASGNTKSCGCLRVAAPKNLAGIRFGKLTVIEYVGHRDSNHYWLCRCDCGNTKEIMQYALVSGKIKSCGCQNRRIKTDCYLGKIKAGDRFHQLTVMELVDRRYNQTIWKCQCDCGNIVEVASGNLQSSHTKSCGCLKKMNWKKRSQVKLCEDSTFLL